MVLIGIYIILEAILALLWVPNDRSLKAQLVRITRIVAGIFIIVHSLGEDS